MNFPEINGFGHIDFTVTDVDRSVRWWEEVMGFKLVYHKETPNYTQSNVVHPGLGAVGLMSTRIPSTARSTNVQ
jgi:catechol 2,3-dioxygenase-like lactoylglutathione lyase family enzyme